MLDLRRQGAPEHFDLERAASGFPASWGLLGTTRLVVQAACDWCGVVSHV
jgi:hypothetical protein